MEQVNVRARGMEFSGFVAGPPRGQAVLLLHGFPQFAASWHDVMLQLASAGYRVVAFDQRGYSAGARPSAVMDYAIEQLVADVVAVADALGIWRFHLAGHDWGGLVAWHLAAGQPERVRTLSVLSTPHPEAFRRALRSDLRQIWMSKYILLFRAPGHLAEKLLLARDGAGLRLAYGGHVNDLQVKANLRRLRWKGTLTAALNWYRALRPEMLAEPWTARIQVPCLYVWGDADVALGRKAALATASFVAAPYRFQRVAGGSHWLLDEMPGPVAQWILDNMKVGEAHDGG